MSGHPGTPRFGVPADMHNGKPNDSGQNVLNLQTSDDAFKEQHALYNPAQKSRGVGQDPAKYYVVERNAYEAPCNHDDYEGGDAHISNLDEQKVLRNTVFAIPIECADDNGYRAPVGKAEGTA